MAKKKWTAKTEITDDLLKFREKRKWQIALRRYVLLRQPSSYYAPFFGIDIRYFRNWIEMQFEDDQSWENFSKAWQFDQVIPFNYFDHNSPDDLGLCWNFVNIRILRNQENKIQRRRIDLISAKSYFENLFSESGYLTCRRMVEKIEKIETAQITSKGKLEDFIAEKATYLNELAEFTSYEYDKLNKGMELDQILREKEFLKKYGE